MLGDLARWARDIVRSAGYPGIIAAMVAENVFPPIPSEIVLPLAGYEVSRGTLVFVWAVLAATLGSLLGAYVLYAIGRVGGRVVVLRWGRVLRVGEADLDRSERWFGRWGDWVVLGGRVVPLARSLVSIPAGLTRMGLGRFTVLTTIGSLVWNIVLIGAGYLLGSQWEDVSRVVGRYSDVAALVVVAALAVGLYWLLRRRARSRA
jgi:membrane protein DedA with SNARE-associated domain